MEDTDEVDQVVGNVIFSDFERRPDGQEVEERDPPIWSS